MHDYVSISFVGGQTNGQRDKCRYAEVREGGREGTICMHACMIVSALKAFVQYDTHCF